MNSSLEKLAEDLSNNDFNYLTEEFGSKNLKLLKQKMLILISTWTVFKESIKKLPDKKCFHRSVKDGTTNDNGKN